MIAGAAAAVAQTVLSAAGCKAEGSTTAAGTTTAFTSKDFDAVLSQCIGAGEQCLTHCLALLSKGNSSLGACAERVRDMLAVCRSTQVLASAGSSHLPAAAALCADVCESCRVECAKHAGHHAECRACEKACAAVIPAARAFATA